MNTPPLPTLSEVLKVLQDSPRGPMKAKELAQALRVPTERYRAFKSFLRDLEQSGELYRTRKSRYAVPGKINLTVGVLKLIRAGDAFLNTEGEGGDVFVPSQNLESAMDGDRVAVRIESHPKGRAPVGRVVKVLDRARETVVGTFHRNRSFGFVRPLDSRIPRDILVPAGKDEGAGDGDVVVVRIEQYGSRSLNSSGSIERILGPMDEPGVDVLAVLHGHGLVSEFPPEVEAAAREASDLANEAGGHTDRRALLVFTIDPPDAKDHDDALSISHVREGVWEVGVHIADVSHFVRPGGALDAEALDRGCSVYLVDQVIPMLPHALSSEMCSLKAGHDRLALSLFLTLDLQGRVRDHRFERTLISSRHSLHYEQVHGVLAGKVSVDPEVDDAIRTLDRLARAVRAKRSARGSLDFDLPESRVVLDDEGRPVDVRKVVQLDSHRLIEDFMVLANEVVAQEGVKRKLPIPYRIHEPPKPDRIEDLRQFLSSLGHALPKGPVDGRALQKVLDRVEGRPEEALISTVVLRAMNRARYDPVNVGHFGLGSEAYAHFTSPIRRYPDLVLHRVVIRALVEGRPVPEDWGGEYLKGVSEQASEREKTAQQAERDSVEMKKIEFMRRHLGEDFSGTISGVVSFGFFVVLDDFFVEGLVHVSTLNDDYYSFLEEAYSLVGQRTKRRFRLGDRVRVQVVRADKEERKIDFLLLEPAKGTKAD